MTNLTIPNDVTEIEYIVGAVASNGPFTIPFNFFKDEDVKVSVNDGTITTVLDIVDDYSVSGVSQDGGFEGGSTTLVVPVSNSTVKVFRDIVIDRLTEFPKTGPFDIASLNDELNKIIAIEQELETKKNKFLFVPNTAISTDPFDASTRAITNIGESVAATAAATNRQVDAAGPNGVADDNLESAALTVDVFNTVISISGIVIQGTTTPTTKLFDLITEFHTMLQNRGSLEAQVYMRYRFIVDCYSEISKQSNSTFRLKIPATSMMPFPFMDVAQDIDYFNGDGTLSVFIDIYPLGVASNMIHTQWNNLAVTTMEPR